MDNEKLKAEAREFFDTEYPKCNSNGWLVMARFAAKKLAEAGQSADWVAPEPLEVISILNAEIAGIEWPETTTFWWRTDGYADEIGIEDLTLWDSESDAREYDENDVQEPLLDCVRRLFQEKVQMLRIHAEPQPYKQEKTK